MTPEPEILLVEDNPIDRKLALHALRRHNLVGQRRVARDGVEALEWMEQAATLPRVVLLDLKLPRLDGLEVLRRVEASPRTRAVPIIMLTSSREERDVAESYQLGANSYIVEPVDFEQFVEAVRQLAAYWLQLDHS